MLIAVTGATGFLGRYIVNHLLDQGHTCRCWYRPSSDRRGFVSDGQNIEWMTGHLDDQTQTDKLTEGINALIHSGLDRQSGWSPDDANMMDFLQANFMGTVRLIQSAQRAGVARFVFISTCAVHDVILPDRALDEAHPLWPYSHYGAHKAAIEKFVHSFGLPQDSSRKGWDICALRPTGIYGVAQPVQNSRWFDMVRDVVAGKPVDKVRGGKEVHAADVARAASILLAQDPGVVAGQCYNCYDQFVTTQDVAQIAKRLSGSSSVITKETRTPKNQIDTSKIVALGMQFGGMAILEKTVAQLVEAAIAERERS